MNSTHRRDHYQKPQKKIRVLVTENVCNVVESSRLKAFITASVRAAKIRCHGGKGPIPLILNKINYNYQNH